MTDVNDFQKTVNQEITIENVSFNAKAEKKGKEQIKNVSQIDNWKLHFAAGLISGPVSRTLTAPIDRMRLQIQITPTRQTILEIIHGIMKNETILTFWRGNGINVMKVAPETAIRFGLYDRIKQIFYKEGEALNPFKRFLAASTAGLAALVFIYPLEVLRTRMMSMEPGEFNSALHAVQKIFSQDGPRGFFRGFTSSVCGIIPYTGIDLTVYEILKNRFIASQDERPEAWKLIFCACTSITCGQLASYPFYLVKARQQARKFHPSIAAAEETPGFCTVCKIVKAIVKQDGFFGLYRGVSLTLGRVLPSGVINYIVYEHAKRILLPYFT